MIARVLLWIAGTALALLALATIVVGTVRGRAELERIHWGVHAISELSRVPRVNFQATPDLSPAGSEWVGDSALYMTNGEVIVYRSRHGKSLVVNHLFLGRSSDGRWLYSSYHFCNGMAMVRGEDPPPSVDDFCRRYAVQEFAPESDTWSQHTWPP